MNKNAKIGGTLLFRIPYGGRAKFDWWLDRFEHDVIVECTSPWKGLHTDVHQIGMGPRFSREEARRLAEVLARRIIGNLDYVVQHRLEDVEFVSYYDNQQLPLYRKWAWEEAKRRMIEVGLLAEAFRDDDGYDEDESPDDNAMPAEYEERADEDLKASPVELIE